MLIKTKTRTPGTRKTYRASTQGRKTAKTYVVVNTPTAHWTLKIRQAAQKSNEFDQHVDRLISIVTSPGYRAKVRAIEPTFSFPRPQQ